MTPCGCGGGAGGEEEEEEGGRGVGGRQRRLALGATRCLQRPMQTHSGDEGARIKTDQDVSIRWR